MTGFFSKKPKTREQIRAIHAKERVGGIKQQIKIVRENRFVIEDQLKRNNRNQLSPQEQAVIVTSSRSVAIEKGDVSDLPSGEQRDDKVSIVLEKQREKLIKKEGDLEFKKGKLEIVSKR